MSRDRLQIELRRRQLVLDAVNVVVNCTNENTAEYVPGTVDQTWINFTDFVTGLDKMQFSWDYVNSSAAGETTETNPGGSNYDKGLSAELQFNDEAFQFIYDHLLESPCGVLNSVEARITDHLAGGNRYRIFEIKADNITYEPDDAPCEFIIRLREADPVWHCIHKTFIWDNWQDWFTETSSKQHPTFLVGVETRPRLTQAARLGINIFAQTVPLVNLLFPGNDNVYRRILNVDNFSDAPLIRDYIDNVAGKCGLSVDTLFHDESSPYYNVCLFYPIAGQFHYNDGDSVTSPSLAYNFQNRWNITLADLLDKLKPVFKAEWYVTPNNTIVFKNKKDFLNTTPIYDFTLVGALPMRRRRYTFGGTKKPAYGKYTYNTDASDLASQELLPLYNDIVDYDGPANNPMLEGNITNTFEFAPTGFIRDGRSKDDYLISTISDGEAVAYGLVGLLAIIVVALVGGTFSVIAAAILAAFLAAWILLIADKANDLRDIFSHELYTGAVRLTSDQVAMGRLIIWDDESFNQAKVVSNEFADLIPDPYYNPDLTAYEDENKFLYEAYGVSNYPMYFDSKFQDNMYDRFHEPLDNPLLSLDTNQTVNFETDLCPEMLQILGVWEGDFAKIGYLLLLEHRVGYDVFARIEHFDVNYESNTIAIKGKVIKVKN